MKYNPESFTIGLISGLFTVVGVDPEMIVYRALAEIIDEIGGHSLSIVFMIIVVILLLAEFLIMLSEGGDWALTLLIFGWGFLAGLLLLTAAIISVILIGAYLLIGNFS